MMANNHGFFTKSYIHNTAEAFALDIGDDGDAEFRALVIAILHNYLTHPKMSPKILTHLLEDSPEYLKLLNTSSPIEQINFLIAEMGGERFVQELTFNLRQIAAREIFINPILYRNIFTNMDYHFTIKNIFYSGVRIYENAPASVANALSIPIRLEKGDVLRAHTSYASSAKNVVSNPGIVLRVDKQHYMPVVTSAVNKFHVTGKRYGQKSTALPILPDNEAMGALYKQVQTLDSEVRREYEANLTRLNAMVKSGEINKKDLLEIYIDGKEGNNRSLPRFIGAEYGHSELLELMISPKREETPFVSSERAIVNKLIHALAAEMSLGLLSKRDVWPKIEALDLSDSAPSFSKKSG